MLDELVRELKAAAAAHDARFAAAAAPAMPAYVRLSLTWQPGTRVLDLVTGESGTVVDGKRESVITGPASNAGD